MQSDERTFSDDDDGAGDTEMDNEFEVFEEVGDEDALPDQLTGRAASTSEDLTTLFRNQADEHLTDGFRGGSDDDDDAVIEDGEGRDGQLS